MRKTENMEKNIFDFNYENTPEGWIYIKDDKSRYILGQPGERNLVIVGLNPSNATPQKPDPTIKKVKKIAELENMDGWIMVNLYPIKETYPPNLPKNADEELISKNLSMIAWLKKNVEIEKIYASWGCNIKRRKYLVEQCQKIAEIMDENLWYIKGMTKSGHPRHPSRIGYNVEMEKFDVKDYLKNILN